MYNNHSTDLTESAARHRAEIEAERRKDRRRNAMAKGAIYAMMLLLALAIIYSRWREWQGQH